jgi:DNA (cytosine-5)-methyltransferase 1
MKVLNLYAGIGGNRKLWKDVEVTAVELDPEIANIYKSYFPQDNVIICDAHQYLLDHYKEFDFIWSSFPCVTHTRMNINFNIVRYPDLKLYEEIIFLDSFFQGKYVVENVIPYYEPLIPAQQHNRHLFWANFKIKTTGKGNPKKQIANIQAQHTKNKLKNIGQNLVKIKSSQPHFGFDLSKIKTKNRKDKLLRNCVDPDLGLLILECAFNVIKNENIEQLNLNI